MKTTKQKIELTKEADAHLPSKEDQLLRITNVRSAQQRIQDAASLPPILMLLGVFFHSGELAILFADTGVGKSVFAVAAGNVIAAGTSFLSLSNESLPQVVLYYDFELSDKQFQKRYSNESGNVFSFHPNFYVSNLSLDEYLASSKKTSFDNLLVANIERDIVEKQAKVVIIDNLTYLKQQPMQEQDTALAIMRKLSNLKLKYNISILVLAHTPKIYISKPLNITNLGGSKHLSNFADSVFCIGNSAKDLSLRYLKQVKPSRSAEMIYDTKKVILIKLSKTDSCLTFEFIGYDSEYNHLAPNVGSNQDLKILANELHEKGNSYSQIATFVGKSKSTIDRWLNSNKS